MYVAPSFVHSRIAGMAAGTCPSHSGSVPSTNLWLASDLAQAKKSTPARAAASICAVQSFAPWSA